MKFRCNRQLWKHRRSNLATVASLLLLSNAHCLTSQPERSVQDIIRSASTPDHVDLPPPPPLTPIITRRSSLHLAFAAAAAATTTTTASLPSFAAPAPSSSTVSPPPERTALLSLIDSGAGDDAVLRAIDALLPLDPSGGRAASPSSASDLGGTWRLIWSFGAEAFSPLLTLPRPLRPESYQYLGDAAASEVGEGRVAQGLAGGVLSVLGRESQLWLSAGSVPAASASGEKGDRDDSSSVLVIEPPFRLQLGGRAGSGREKRTIVEGGSDAEFRKANARNVEAQMAPPNRYKQLYLEGGGTGAIRISTITEGDPVIVGEIFVHQKM